MRLKIGQDKYRLRGVGIIDAVTVEYKGCERKLQPVSSATMATLKSDGTGMPRAYSFSHAESKLTLQPAPNRGMLLNIYYYPQMRKL